MLCFELVTDLDDNKLSEEARRTGRKGPDLSPEGVGLLRGPLPCHSATPRASHRLDGMRMSRIVPEPLPSRTGDREILMVL